MVRTYCSDPHQLIVEGIFENLSVISMPSVEDDISISLGVLLNIANFALAEDLGAMIPSIGNVVHENRVLGTIINPCTILARAS